ncbi:MAG: tetratricopeptide repeat protein [Acidobacteriota bacterium]|nr:tetratricopeptide repeat protein [Acidobacteriota bacterium]
MRCLAIRLQTLLAFLLITCPTFAQRDRDTFTPSPTLEISGHVRLTETGQPGRNIEVRLERFSGGIVDQLTTDSAGRFRFIVPQRGYYTVLVNAPGFNPAQQQADLQVLFRAYLVFELVTDKSVNPASAAGPLGFIDARVPSAARDEFARAEAALARKDFEEAIPHLQKAVFIHPEFYEAQLLLGTTLMDLRRWEKAEETLRRTLKIKPDSASALLALGEVYWRQKRNDEAEKTLQQGLKLDDKAWHGYFTLGRLYWDKGEFAKAGPPIGKTLQLKPDFAEAHLIAGNILLRLAQQERALVEYQEYLKLEPKGEFAQQARELVEKLSKAIVENKKSIN